MCFVEPIVCLFAIRYLDMYVFYLFAEIFAKLFNYVQHNSNPEVLCFFKKLT